MTDLQRAVEDAIREEIEAVRSWALTTEGLSIVAMLDERLRIRIRQRATEAPVGAEDVPTESVMGPITIECERACVFHCHDTPDPLAAMQAAIDAAIRALLAPLWPLVDRATPEGWTVETLSDMLALLRDRLPTLRRLVEEQ